MKKLIINIIVVAFFFLIYKSTSFESTVILILADLSYNIIQHLNKQP